MRLLLTLAFVFTLAFPALAAYTGPGATPPLTTAAQALGAADDAPCALEGYLVEKVTGKKEKYVFQDKSGTIIVDIDTKVFAGRDVGPKDKVRLEGDVDKELTRPNEVDVKHMEIVR